MEAKELMIGDWVNWHTYKDRPHYCHITRLEQFRHLDCSPIPLTASLLEKNGFKDYVEIREYQFEEDGEKYRFYLKKMYNRKNGEYVGWGTNIGGVLPSLITYVHELQHALRLCGLTDLADNFTI